MKNVTRIELNENGKFDVVEQSAAKGVMRVGQ